MPDAVLRAIAEHTISAIVVVNGAGRIVLVNDQTERLFGHTRDRLLGQPIETLVPEGFAQAHERHRQSYTRQPQPRPMGIGREPEARRHDGSTFPVDVSLTPLSTETGDTVIATAILNGLRHHCIRVSMRGDSYRLK